MKAFDLARAQALMRDEHLDVLVATSPENTWYVGGYPIRSRIYLPKRLALAMVPAEGDPVLIVPGWEEVDARDQSWIGDVRSYRLFTNDPLDFLEEVFGERGLSSGHIGIERQHLSVMDYEEMVRRFPRALFRGCDNLFSRMRAVKTQEEIAVMRKAARAAEKAVWDTIHLARAGDSERDLYRHLVNIAIQQGADLIKAVQLGSGKRASFVWGCYPSEKTLQVGEVVRIDLVLDFMGYNSDLARMAAVGPPSERQKRIYQTLSNGLDSLKQAIRPGVAAKEAYQAVERTFQELGMPLNAKDVGHGIGLKLHEDPILHPKNLTPLEENMVLSVEVPYLAEGFVLEDTIVVTKSSCELLTDYSNKGEMPVISDCATDVALLRE